MKMIEDTIETRLANIENILKMLLINSVYNYGSIEAIKKDIENCLHEKIIKIGIKEIHLNQIENEYYLFAEMDFTNNYTWIKKTYHEMIEVTKELPIVFVFPKLSSRILKLLERDRISYYARNKECRIFK